MKKESEFKTVDLIIIGISLCVITFGIIYFGLF